MSPEHVPNSEATDKERFDLLYSRLKSVHDIFIDVVFKATGAFLLVTGWAVASDTARTHIRGDPVSKWLSVLGLFIYASLFALAAFRTARSSKRISELLKELAYMPHSHYSDVVVPGSVVAVFGTANTVLCIAVAILVFRNAG
jgi:uncharacterized membrane protein